MKTNQHIEDQVERALHSLDNCKPASPSPYLMTRINAALGATNVMSAWDKLYSIIARPAIAMVALTCILLLNVFMITSYQNNDDTIRFQADSNGDWQSYPTVTNNALYDVENNLEP